MGVTHYKGMQTVNRKSELNLTSLNSNMIQRIQNGRLHTQQKRRGVPKREPSRSATTTNPTYPVPNIELSGTDCTF